MAGGPWNQTGVLLVCWVVMQVMPPLCLASENPCRPQSGFHDLGSRTVRASLILLAKARRVLKFDAANGTQGVVFSVERILKGGLPVIGPYRSQIVVLFSEDLGGHSLQECLRSVVRVGSHYVVFVDDGRVGGYVLRRRGLMTSVKASGLPRISMESVLRTVQNYSCSRCGRSPRAQIWPQIVDLTVGKRLELECRATGRPTPQVTWFKDGVVIPRGSRVRWKNTRNGSRLRIRRVGVRDSGLFQCIASNVLGTSNAPRSKVTISRNKFRRPHSRVCEEQSYCLNGGICHRLKSLNITFCHCRSGFEGERCQQKQLGLNALNFGKFLI